jgi:hypothetical protein
VGDGRVFASAKAVCILLRLAVCVCGGDPDVRLGKYIGS